MIDGESSEKWLENVGGITVRAAILDGTLTTLQHSTKWFMLMFYYILKITLG